MTTVRRLKDTSAHACGPALTVREAMARINATPELFQIIVADDGRVLGTVTDGDIRRAILRGVELDARVNECMNPEALIGRIGEDAANTAMLAKASGVVPFLPVVDEQRRLTEVMIAPATPPALGTALVMAGGFGRRLGPMTRETPKPLLQVGGRPIIAHLLDRLDAAGFEQVVVAVHYLAEQFEHYLGERLDRGGVRLVHEERPLGTAGAIALLEAPPREPFLVINADVMTDVDFAALRAFHERHEHDGTVAVAQYEMTVPFGVVRHDGDGLLESIEEKPKLTHVVAAGIYLLSPEFCALVRRDEPLDMPTLINRSKASGLKIGLFPVHEYWCDIGRPADLDAANHENHATTGAAGGGRQR